LGDIIDYGNKWKASYFKFRCRVVVGSTIVQPSAKPVRVVVLGSTGSIGVNTLDVARSLPDRLHIVGLCAHSSWPALCQQAHEFRPRWVTLTDSNVFAQANRADLPPDTELLCGIDGIRRMVQDADVDAVVSAIVGIAGLEGTWAALEKGKLVALANKETLVVAGEQIAELTAQYGGRILPVDSEHSAIFQAIHGHSLTEVARVVLTASGGPFRGRSRTDLAQVTVDEALKHPTWRMGPKISIDSATMMNKTLEVIEARWLFQLTAEQIDVIVHPESIVHSFVEFVDGSVMAQLSPPDMRLPIQYALLYPERIAGPTRRLAWSELKQLTFATPDRETFPALELGFEVIRRGGTCGSVLNAANEQAVELFLAGRLPFLDISRACADVLAQHDFLSHPSLDELWAADRWARQEVSRWTRLQHHHPLP